MQVALFGVAVMHGTLTVFLQVLLIPGIVQGPDGKCVVAVGKGYVVLAGYTENDAGAARFYLIVGWQFLVE